MRIDYTEALIDAIKKRFNTRNVNISCINNIPFLPIVEADNVTFGQTNEDRLLLKNWIIGNGIDYYDETTINVFDDNPIMKQYTLEMAEEFVFEKFKKLVLENI